MTEADTCREFVTLRLVEAGWGAAESVIGEQRSFTNGRIIVAGGKVRQGKQRRADYLLYCTTGATSRWPSSKRRNSACLPRWNVCSLRPQPRRPEPHHPARAS